jgi:hypothetical protein
MESCQSGKIRLTTNYVAKKDAGEKQLFCFTPLLRSSAVLPQGYRI